MKLYKGVELDFPLAGKKAIVTGGASGIGLSISRAFASKGVQVAVFDLKLESATEIANELGNNSFAVACDVSKRESVQQAIETAKQKMGSIDILVNSAGIVALAPAEDLDDSAWEKTIDINLTGTFLMTQEVGKTMIAAKTGGKIINIASQAATVAIPEHVAYCASKFGVLGLTKVFAAEWGKHGINVNSISPTVVMTELGKKAWDNPKGDELKKRLPVGRFAEPEEIAALAVYLASSASDMVHGADILIDGGFTLE